MVVGYHLIWTVYGFWLPNDPRGSSSPSIRVKPLADLGPLHHGRKFPKPAREELKSFHRLAQDQLAHRVVLFDHEEIDLVGRSIGKVIAERGYGCHACAILPEHVHLVVRRHTDYAESMIQRFQAASKRMMLDHQRRSPNHPVWGGSG